VQVTAGIQSNIGLSVPIEDNNTSMHSDSLQRNLGLPDFIYQTGMHRNDLQLTTRLLLDPIDDSDTGLYRLFTQRLGANTQLLTIAQLHSLLIAYLPV